MVLKDLLITPVVILVVMVGAYLLRDKYTTPQTRPFFLPALGLKIFGAIMLGIIYQFYYQGGDTFNYYQQSSVIYQAFWESPIIGLKMLFSNGEFRPDTFKYAQLIYWYDSPTEYFVIKVAAVLGLFCFNSYSSIAVLFAVFSFTGLWAAYLTFVKQNPSSFKPIGFAFFFLPSVFFWGSGLMKDTITLGALGWMFYGFYHGFILKDNIVRSLIIMLISFHIIYQVKIYILLSFLPPAIYWVFTEHGQKIRNRLSKHILKPILIILGLSLAYFAGITVTEGDAKYDISNIAGRTKINAEYLYRISLLQEGSAYYLGELDGTYQSMLKIAPNAIGVTLLRPYIWEIRNPLMALSALESAVFTIILFSLLLNPGITTTVKLISQKPLILFCFLFTINLAFAVGLNSFNFGTLVRYKIQLLPFYLSGIILIKHYGNFKQASGTNPLRSLSAQRAKHLS